MNSFLQKDVFLYGKRWFYIIKPNPDVSKTTALLDIVPIEKLSKMLAVCLTITNFPGKQPKPNGKLIRLYTYFESYVDYYLFSISIPVEERSFFEIIFGSSAQKPHFDVDMSHDVICKNYPGEEVENVAETVIDLLITSCIHVLNQVGVSIEIEKSILLYTSHSDKKKSFHLVLNTIYHRNNVQAKLFYKHVVEHFSTLTNKKYIEFIDAAVYSPKQQFRILGCQKPKTNRIKTFLETFTYQNKIYQHEYTENPDEIELKILCALYESMVGFVSGCNVLPYFKDKEIEPTGQLELKINNRPEEICIEATDTMAKIALEMLKSVMNPCPFIIYRVNENIVSLTREAPSMCPLCNIVHEGQHPFMAITNDGRIYWNCRRTEAHKGSTKKLYVGTIPQDGSTFRMPSKQNLGKVNSKPRYNGTYNPKPIEETDFSFGPFKTKLATEKEAERIINGTELVVENTRPKKLSLKTKNVVCVYHTKKSEKNVVDELQKIARDKANGTLEPIYTPKKLVRKEPLSFVQKESTLKKPMIIKKDPEQPKLIAPIIPRKTPIKITK
jgi:hypothetical protein